MSGRRIFKRLIEIIIVTLYIIAVGVLMAQALKPGTQSSDISHEVGDKLDEIITDIQKPETTVINVDSVKILSVTVLGKKYTTDEVEMPIGNSGTIKAEATPSDATNKSLSYSSSDENIVYVYPDGKISAKAVGTAIVTVASVENPELYDTLTVTVKEIPINALTITNLPKELRVGGKHKLEVKYTPTNTSERDVSWTSSDTSVLTVNKSGTVTAKAVGKAIVTVKSKINGELVASVEIEVLPKKETPVIPVESIVISGADGFGYVGKEMTLSAKLMPTGSKGTVIWESADESVATVTQKGVVSFLKSGSVDIIAKCDDITSKVTIIVKEVLTGSIAFDVTDINKNAEGYILKEGTSGKVIAEIDEDATVLDLHFSSSDESIARISQDGVIEALDGGVVTITISSSYEDETVSTSFELTVDPITVKDTVQNFYYKIRKAVGHFGAFLILGILASLSYYIIFPKSFRGKLLGILVCFVAGFAVAGITEILQLPYFTEGRTCSWDDVVLDFRGYCMSTIPMSLMIILMHLVKRFASDSLLVYITESNEPPEDDEKDCKRKAK